MLTIRLNFERENDYKKFFFMISHFIGKKYIEFRNDEEYRIAVYCENVEYINGDITLFMNESRFAFTRDQIYSFTIIPWHEMKGGLQR